MTKGKQTKEMILSKAAGLFNSRGYFGASMSDVMEATGLEKGGIYNHFKSKDELALAAFDFVVTANGLRVKEFIDAGNTVIEKLLGFVDGFQSVMAKPSFPGGCPLLNCSVESDDTHPALRARVRAAIKKILRALETLVQAGIDSGELKNDLEPAVVANFLFASVEGGVLLTKLYEDPGKMTLVAEQAKQYIRSCAAKKE
jgi:AcrR family transcriptional regulator